MAKVTSKGQITIPVSIRRRLSIREGDKVLFLDTADGVMMVNPDVRPTEFSVDEIPEGGFQGLAAPDAADGTAAAGGSEAPAQETVKAAEPEKPPLHENQYDVNKLLDEIRSFREKY